MAVKLTSFPGSKTASSTDVSSNTGVKLTTFPKKKTVLSTSDLKISQAPQTESFGGINYGEGAPLTGTESKVFSVLNKIPVVGKAIQSAYTTAKDTVLNATSAVDKALFPVDYTKAPTTSYEENQKYIKENTPKPLQQAVNAGRAIVATGNIAFLPITMQLEAAKEVPLLKYPAQVVSYGFEKLGEVGSFLTDKGIEALPISNEAKSTIKPLGEELGAFIAQMVGVKAVHGIVKTGGAKVVEKLPISEKAKGKIETTAKVGAGLAMTPFSTAYNLANATIRGKIANYYLQNENLKSEDIKPQDMADIIKETKKEVETEYKKGITEETIKKAEEPVYELATKEAEKTGVKIPQKVSEIKQKIPNITPITIKNDSKISDLNFKIEQMKESLDDSPLKNLSKYESKQYPGTLSEEFITGKGDVIAQNFNIDVGQSGMSMNDLGIAYEQYAKGRDSLNILKEELRQVKGESFKDYSQEQIDKINETLQIASENTSGVVKEYGVAQIAKLGDTKSRVYERLQQETPELNDEPKYEKISLKDDSQKAVELISKNKQQAYRVAMGAEDIPGQTNTAVNIALAEQALKEGNYSLYSQLTKERSLEQTRRGQEIVAEKGSIESNDTSKYVKELLSEKLDKLGKKVGNVFDKFTKKSNVKKATEYIEKEVKKAQDKVKETKKLDLSEAQKIIDKITCK